MADTNYVVPDNPTYDKNIRALQNSDPAHAETVFNPLMLKMISNTHAVKNMVDATQSAGTAGLAAHNTSTLAHADIRAAVQTAQTTANAAYKKPAAGIPKTDLASAVQTSLGKADVAESNAKTYADQLVANIIARDELGIFNYGSTASAILFPSGKTGEKFFSFAMNIAYEYSGGTWSNAPVQPTLQDGSRIDIYKFIDGTDISGASMAGMKGSAIYKSGSWQFGLDANTQSVPDGNTIIQRTTDGKWEVNAKSFSITENVEKFENNTSLAFTSFWQSVLGKINGLITAINNLTASALNKTVFDNITLPVSGWAESTTDGEPAYTQTVTVSGLPDADFTPSVVYTLGDVQAMRKEAQAASCVTAWASVAGKLTAYCLYSKPEQDIKVSVEMIK